MHGRAFGLVSENPTSQRRAVWCTAHVADVEAGQSCAGLDQCRGRDWRFEQDKEVGLTVILKHLSGLSHRLNVDRDIGRGGHRQHRGSKLVCGQGIIDNQNMRHWVLLDPAGHDLTVNQPFIYTCELDCHKVASIGPDTQKNPPINS